MVGGQGGGGIEGEELGKLENHDQLKIIKYKKKELGLRSEAACSSLTRILDT